jgi:DNA-binding CsgD family transcriptional regulator
MPNRSVPAFGTRLSAREAEILALVAAGMSNPQIAARLGLSVLTVKSHLARMAHRLGVGDRAAMVAAGFRLRILSVEDPGAVPPPADLLRDGLLAFVQALAAGQCRGDVQARAARLVAMADTKQAPR